MKKLIILVGLIALLLLVVACARKSPTDYSITERPTTSLPTVIHPRDIILDPDAHHSSVIQMQEPPPFRVVFYRVDSLFTDFVDWDERTAFLRAVGDDALEIMTLARFVQHFNISREEFDNALNILRRGKRETYERDVERGFEVDFASEWNELPCPDIIFTFDNDIINAFYRRENPVAPDWWPVER